MVDVSMLPDLSQDISTEQAMWEEIMQIKAMPVPMVQKKEMKARIQVVISRLKISRNVKGNCYGLGFSFHKKGVHLGVLSKPFDFI